MFAYTSEKMGKQLFVSFYFASLIVLVASHTTIDRSKVTSVSDSGVCFYGASAERILNMLANGEYRHLVPAVQRPKDCSDLDPKYHRSGVYKIYPTAGRGFNVYCDMTTDGGRWTVLIRRMDGSQNFNKNWVEYENGFGDLSREFWLGNKYLNILTSIAKTEMRVDIENFKGVKKYAKYSTFKVGDAASKYRLTVGGFSGNAGDSFQLHKNGKFSTPDQDNDTMNNYHCATSNNRVGAGWWFNSCDNACFTFSYANNKEGLKGEALIQWETWRGSGYSLKYAVMMIRRI